ncbi:MAG: PocR ligand-binding domain-containing protein [Bacillota bacterium]|nr:PocR ligand-binding domain-containing protein [Bacillota bacterium]
MQKINFLELVNINVLQTMVENLCKTVGISVGILDANGTILIAEGWQDICAKYHRTNPASCKRCHESDNYIKKHISKETFVAYKCKNNMWDIAMPILISGKHLATVFVGQFFYEDEILDENFFRNQAIELGFNEEEYINALHKVPVVSKSKVEYILEYYTGLIKTLAESGYRLLEYKRSQEELKKSQQYFKTVLDSVSDAILIFDINNNIIDANQASIRLFGYSKEKLLNMTGRQLISCKSPYMEICREEIVDKIKKCNSFIFESIIIDKQNKETWVEVNNHFTIIDDKERVVVSIRNINERKLSELAALNQALELERLRTEFFANISHELRTPLNIILSSNQMVKMYLQDESKLMDRQKIINNINIEKQNCFRLLRLINNLIDVTKLGSGLFELNLINCNIVNIVEEITLSTSEYISAHKLKLVFDTDVEEKIIACDPDKIERIILNLLSNSVKFTDNDGSIFVNIIDGNEYITITVEDTGIGIPSEKLNLVFEKFRQIDKSLSRNYEGSGLGLSLVRSLVEMHEGNISVESQYGKGTKFIIKLPVYALNKDDLKDNIKYNKTHINNFVERINIEFSDIYK